MASHHIVSQRSRDAKLLGTVVALTATYIAFLQSYLPYRLVGDETEYLPDILRMITTGSVSSLTYPHGILSQVHNAIVIVVVGGDIHTAQWTSPLIGFVVLISILFLLYGVWKTFHTQLWAGIIGIVATMFIFASFFNRLMSVLHGKYTLLFFVVLVWSFHSIGTRNDKRGYILGIITGVSMTSTNTLWPKLYIITIFIVFLVTYTDAWKRFVSLLLQIEVASAMASVYFPFYQFYTVPIYNLVRILRGEKTATPSNRPGVITEASGAIQQWPEVAVMGLKFNIVYLFTIGIAFVFVIGLVSGLSAVYRVSTFRTTKSDRFFLGILTGFSLLLGILFPLNDIDTVRRVSVLPGFFFVLYFTTMITEQRTGWNLTPRKKVIIRNIILILLLTSALLALPRTVRDGKLNPYDRYIGEESFGAIHFGSDYGIDDQRLYFTSADATFHYLTAVFPDVETNPRVVTSNNNKAKIYSAGSTSISI